MGNDGLLHRPPTGPADGFGILTNTHFSRELFLDHSGSPGHFHRSWGAAYGIDVSQPRDDLPPARLGTLRLRPFRLSHPDGVPQTISSLHARLCRAARAGLIPPQPRTRTSHSRPRIEGIRTSAPARAGPVAGLTLPAQPPFPVQYAEYDLFGHV